MVARGDRSQSQGGQRRRKKSRQALDARGLPTPPRRAARPAGRRIGRASGLCKCWLRSGGGNTPEIHSAHQSTLIVVQSMGEG